MENIILIGYGGHAKSVVDCIERENKYNIIGYTDEEERISKYKYLGTDDILEEYFDQGVRNAVLGIGYLGKGQIRQNIYKRLKTIGYSLPIIKDPTAIISDTAKIGEGTFIGKNAVINAEAIIGKAVIVNTMALVEHECIVSDFSHVAVATVLCGQVHVGEAAFIGANATILQGREIKTHQVVPAGKTIR